MWAVSSWLNWSNRQRCLRTSNVQDKKLTDHGVWNDKAFSHGVTSMCCPSCSTVPGKDAVDAESSSKAIFDALNPGDDGFTSSSMLYSTWHEQCPCKLTDNPPHTRPSSCSCLQEPQCYCCYWLQSPKRPQAHIWVACFKVQLGATWHNLAQLGATFRFKQSLVVDFERTV